MSNASIRRIVILAIVALLGIIGTQMYWVNTAVHLQEKENERAQRLDSLNQDEFNAKVKAALSNIAQDILTINNDPSEPYKAVEQLRPNYFVVRINDTLHPYLLEQLLKREFDRSQIEDNYRYGIYDCFTDSIVYSSLVTAKPNKGDVQELSDAPQIKWNTDGHYFSVTFPNKSNIDDSSSTLQSTLNPWIMVAGATLVIISFIAYAIWIILRQKRLSEVKTDFINNMTHELKTPISTISLSSEVLLRPDIKDNPERIQRYAKIIYEENARLQSQVEKVLQLAKLDKGEVKLNYEPLELNEMIQQTLDAHEPEMEHNEGKLHFVSDIKNAVINGDRVHIGNILHNLVDNACKYSENTPAISIELKEDAKNYIVSISDNGIGIDKEHLPYIFDKFYRVPTGNRHDVKGFGLGLYYVKQIIEKHDGKITAASQKGKGSTFKLTLPKLNENE